MKGKILLLFFIAIMLSSCQNISQSTTLNSETKSTIMNSELPPDVVSTGNGTESKEITEGRSDPSNNEVFSMSIGDYELIGEFYDEMLRNPIDHDYEVEFNEFQNSKEITTLGWGALESKYTEIWDKELNQIYKKLLSKLDKEPREALIESQKEWLQYHLRETKFVEKTFINNDYLGSQGSVSLGRVIRERNRERTMRLFEYRYLLDGEVEFLYQSKK
ncbi:lysozyme inhibitor LprI family protein [Paenibacillus sp. Dod16]|uniref:lysozyme inhibitor LprI family protein n=1 Tax=Paenibacillus sp. Dod16 TaxID=3416392 RepID=UPI003CF9B514